MTRKQYLRSGIWLTASSFAVPITALITGPILARVLGPDGRGEAAAVFAPLALLEGIAAIGLPIAVAYFVSKGSNSRTVLRKAIPLGLAATLLAYAGLYFLAPLLFADHPDLITLARFAALYLFAVSLIGIARGVRNGEERYAYLSAERYLQAAIRFGLIAGFAATALLTPASAIWINIAAATLSGVALFIPPRKPSVPKERQAPSTSELVSFSLRSWLGHLGSTVTARLDQAILIVFVAVGELGIYVVAATLAELPILAYIAAQKLLMGAATGAAGARRSQRAIRLTAFAGISMAICLGLLAPLLIPTLFGSEFGDAVQIAWLLLAATVPWGIGLLLSSCLTNTGNPGRASMADLVGAALAIGLLIALAPSFGIAGAAVATIIAYSASAGAKLFLYQRINPTSLRLIFIPTSEDFAWTISQLAKRRSAPSK